MKGSARVDHRSAIDIIEEAVHTLKAHPSGLVAYYIGSLPFVLLLLYFWTDMSRGANAWQHCSEGAWALAFCFVWMKTWQAVYARGLLGRIRQEGARPWGVRRILRAAAFQTAIQPWGIVLLPVALVIMLPFPQVFAFFQNATLIGSGNERDMGEVVKKSWAQASLRPGQNTLSLWLASPFLVMLAAALFFVVVPILMSSNIEASGLPFLLAAGLVMIPLCPLGMVVALNAGLSLFLIPWLLRTFLGIETVFSVGGFAAVNDTSLAIICGLVYLCLDPVLKAVYCLRCFYGESLRTGEDLLVELRALKRDSVRLVILLVILLGCASVGHALAESRPFEPSGMVRVVSARDLDGAIDRVMNSPEYTWRMPRTRPPAARDGALHAFLAPVVKALRAAWRYVERGLLRLLAWVVDFINRMLPSDREEEGGGNRWTSLSRILIIAPLAAMMALIAFLWWRARKGRKVRAVPSAGTDPTLPDITKAEVDARALPEEGWLSMAREMAAKGESRLALRALFLASLAFLSHEDLISLAPHKSDREYERELRLRSHARPYVPPVFAENRVIFERAWYGLHEVTPAIMERFSGNMERMRDNGQK